MTYLLDTNIVSDLIRRPTGAVAACISRVGEASVVTSIVVTAELRFGVQRRGSARLARQLEAVLAVLPTLPLKRDVDRHYADIRTELERQGTPIGANDLLIAAHARAIDAILVTDNVREFSRVPSLSVENWLRGS